MQENEVWPSNSKWQITQVANVGYYDNVDVENLGSMHKGTQESIAKTKIQEKRDKDTIRLVCISDTHEAHDKLILPEGDILIHAGDFSYTGQKSKVEEFSNWLGKQTQFKHRIVIAGNHDLPFDEKWYKEKWKRFHGKPLNCKEVKESLKNCIYLEDQDVTVEGLKFYGSPYQPEFGDWAFNLQANELEKEWSKIPEGIDILITHGPPAKNGGIVMGNKIDAGCYYLDKKIKEIKPLAHICGHIHEGYGVRKDDHTVYVNASSVTYRYSPLLKPIIIDISKKN